MNPLRWLGGNINIRVEISVAAENDVGLWDSGEWDENAWASPDGVFEDVSDYVQSVEIDRGKARWDDRFEAGRCTVILDNTDGRWTPETGANPYDYQFRPGRLIRIIAEPSASRTLLAFRLFTGRVEDARDETSDASSRIVTVVSAVDALGELSANNPPATSATGTQLTSERVTAALDYGDWSDTARDIQTGLHTMQSSTLAQSTLEEIMRAGDAEGGLVYADVENRVVFRNRDWLQGGTPSMVYYHDRASSFILKEPEDAFWQMSGAATADSGVGANKTLTWNGSPGTGTVGVLPDDEAVTLDGTNDYATVANEGEIFFEELTVECWVRPHDDSGSVQTIVSCGETDDPLYELCWDPTAGGFVFGPTTASNATISFGSGLDNNEWYHVVVTVDKTLSQRRIRCYINGDAAGDSGTVTYLPNPTSPAVNIGRRAGNADRYFDGDISELVIAGHPVDVNEVAITYDSVSPPNTRATTVQGYLGYETPPGSPYASLQDVSWSYELARIENDVQLARVGSTVQQATDTDSIARFGRRSYSRTDLENNDDAEVLVLAERRLAANKTLRRRIESVTLAPNPDPDDLLLNRLLYETEFGDMLAVQVNTFHDWTFEGYGHVIGIHHSITPGLWSTTFKLDDSLISPED